MRSNEAIWRGGGNVDLSDFGALYDRYASGLWSLILNFTKDEVLAEKVLETSFIHIWQRREEYDPAKTTLVAWMVGIALHECLGKLQLPKNEITVRLKQLIKPKQ